jgi:DNA-directed RNA polymerase specialized sigma24 family protein
MCLANLADGELIQLVVNQPWNEGGAEAFWTLWLRYENWIKRKVQARGSLAWECGCTPDEFCEGVENRVREKIKSLKRYRGGNVQGLLERIINTAAIDEYRYWKCRPRKVDPGEALGPQPDTDSPLDDEVLDLLAYRAGMFYPSPGRILAAKDRSDKIQIMLGLMAAESKEGLKQARVLREHYMEGKTVEEIAQDRGVDKRTVSRWLEDGREAAKRILKETFQVTSLEDL